MPVTLIQSNTKRIAPVSDISPFFLISELFGNTVQGEGINIGCPATFMRMTGCTLDCVWCDTAAVWREGNRWTFDEIFYKFEDAQLIDQFKHGQHLILTGGSPLKQQARLAEFLDQFEKRYNFLPCVEVENETVLMPAELIPFVGTWNNSPKLLNSGMKERSRYKPEIIKFTAGLRNSWFKFVVTEEADWQEIKRQFIDSGMVKRSQIILMPEGQDQEQLSKTREMAVDLAIREGVRFTDRLHITIWNKKTGV